MQFYQVIESQTDEHMASAVYAGTLSDAHAAAKVIAGRIEDAVYRSEIRILLVEIPTDKASLVDILNGGPLVHVKEAGRAWSLTNRLGLKEIEDVGSPAPHQ